MAIVHFSKIKKVAKTFSRNEYRMGKEFFKFGKVEIEKRELHYSKMAITISDVNALWQFL